MPLARFEPTLSAGELPQTYALDCVATSIGYREDNLKIYLQATGRENVYRILVAQKVYRSQ